MPLEVARMARKVCYVCGNSRKASLTLQSRRGPLYVCNWCKRTAEAWAGELDRLGKTRLSDELGESLESVRKRNKRRDEMSPRRRKRVWQVAGLILEQEVKGVVACRE